MVSKTVRKALIHNILNAQEKLEELEEKLEAGKITPKEYDGEYVKWINRYNDLMDRAIAYGIDPDGNSKLNAVVTLGMFGVATALHLKGIPMVGKEFHFRFVDKLFRPSGNQPKGKIRLNDRK